MIEIFREQFFGPFGPLGSRAYGMMEWQFYLILLGAIISSITVHEFGHAWAADRLGDPTPRSEKRVTLNPLAHMDPLGSLLMIVTLFFNLPIGWGRPVRTNPEKYSCGPRMGTALVAIAGPLMNLLFAILLAPLARFVLAEGLGHGPLAAWTWLTIAAAMLVNLSLFLFNLVPVHPLDGSHIAASALPERLSKPYRVFMKHCGPYVLLGLVASGTLPRFIAPLLLKLFRLLIGI